MLDWHPRRESSRFHEAQVRGKRSLRGRFLPPHMSSHQARQWAVGEARGGRWDRDIIPGGRVVLWSDW